MYEASPMDSLLVPVAALSFFALMVTIISFWVKRSPWIWGSFLIFVFILAYFAHLIEPIALIPIIALFFLHGLLKGKIRGVTRFLLVLLTIAISLGLLMHLFPGFHNWKVVENVSLTPDAYPFSLYLNLDKPFIGLFVLALGFPLLSSFKELGQVVKMTLPLILGGIILMILFSLFSGLILWEPKFPSFFWFFALENLLFVSILEEAFWRGFIQKELFHAFGQKGYLANVGCVLITASFFALLHYKWVPSLPFLGLVFLAGVIYGSIYQYTKALETSILCHWLLNLTHFTLFTYPVLKTAM